MTPAHPQLRIRVDLAPGCSVGPGKISLLEAIDREGSLSMAARSIGLSYRRAWDLLADLNRSFARPVVATAVGGVSGGGARLTDHGRSLIVAFRTLEQGALRMAATRLRRFTPSKGSGAQPARRRRVSAALVGARRGRARKTR
jgi:molybdate transport system regulatory protein